ncbi:MAG: RNA polymerase sigma factor [Brevinematia bacterium]
MDEKDYSEIFSNMRGIIISYFLSNKVSFQDVEDLVNEVFVLVWKYRNTLRNREKVRSWVFSIAKNILRKYKSFVKKNKKATLELKEDIVDQERKVDEENFNFALSIINKLPNRYRDIVILFYIEGKSLKEISDILGISETNCKVRLFRARNKLRKLLIYENNFLQRGDYDP